MTDLLGDHVDLFIGTPQSIVPQVKAGKLKAYGVTSKDKMPEFPTADSIVDAARAEVRDRLLAGHVRAGRNTGGGDQDAQCGGATRRVTIRTIVKIWADTGVAAFPKDQRTPAAGEAILKSEIARWGQVIRDNNIHVTSVNGGLAGSRRRQRAGCSTCSSQSHI